MFKFKYAITYKCRPNKKVPGVECAMSITTSANLDRPEEQAKVLKMLSKIHRVNPSAIELGVYHLERREFKPVQWVKDKVKRLFKGAVEKVA